MNSRPACGGYPGEESRHRQNNMIPDLVSSNAIKETESEREKEVGIQLTILNIASHPMINTSAWQVILLTFFPLW